MANDFAPTAGGRNYPQEVRDTVEALKRGDMAIMAMSDVWQAAQSTAVEELRKDRDEFRALSDRLGGTVLGLRHTLHRVAEMARGHERYEYIVEIANEALIPPAEVDSDG